MRVGERLFVEAVLYRLAKNRLHDRRLDVLQVFQSYRLFLFRAEIQGVYLVEDVHVRLVYLVFSVHLAVGKDADVLASCEALLHVVEAEIVVPHHGRVGPQYVGVIGVVRVRCASRSMIFGEIE